MARNRTARAKTHSTARTLISCVLGLISYFILMMLLFMPLVAGF